MYRSSLGDSPKKICEVFQNDDILLIKFQKFVSSNFCAIGNEFQNYNLE